MPEIDPLPESEPLDENRRLRPEWRRWLKRLEIIIRGL